MTNNRLWNNFNEKKKPGNETFTQQFEYLWLMSFILTFNELNNLSTYWGQLEESSFIWMVMLNNQKLLKLLFDFYASEEKTHFVLCLKM
jgi:hypothetical protein